jgi:hypothetical protein
MFMLAGPLRQATINQDKQRPIATIASNGINIMRET